MEMGPGPVLQLGAGVRGSEKQLIERMCPCRAPANIATCVPGHRRDRPLKCGQRSLSELENSASALQPFSPLQKAEPQLRSLRN